MAKNTLRVLGTILVIGGFAAYAAPDRFWGMHLSAVHNSIYWITGGIALLFGLFGPAISVRYCSLALGTFYLLLALVGFIDPALVVNIIHGHLALEGGSLIVDNLIHLLLGVLFLAAGLMGRAQTRATV